MWILDGLKARKDSGAAAMVHRGDKITYRELWDRSESAARWICENTKTMNPVLIYGNKDIGILTAMIAALKSGRAYVPVDVTFPVERLGKIAGITGAEVIFNFSGLDISSVTREGAVRAVGPEQFRDLERLPCPEPLSPGHWVKDGDNCYILFTSGSTGEPKGVQISKRNILNFTDWFSRYAAPEEGTAALNQVSYSFDVSVIQLYIYLPNGVTLFNIDKGMLDDFGELFGFLRTSGITAWVSTPAFIEMCAVYGAFSAELLPNLKKIILAGEVLTKKLVRSLWDKFPGAEVVNGYGPTEGTVLLTCCAVTPEMMADEANELPIGTILDGGTFWLESGGRRVEAEGEKGELIVSSASISSGYYKNPEATARSFFLSGGVQTYRTGDLAYVLGGLIYYCGRTDFQIKLNGYRIELDDISENLNKIGFISNNVVLPAYRDGRVAFIAAFVVLSRDLGLSAPKTSILIRKELAERVPSYMVPKKIVVLKEFPLNTNGKIDRAKLKETYL